jgi:GTP cyclohydrolase II
MAGVFGAAEHVAIERGLAEFRSGRPVLIAGAGSTTLAMPVDGMADAQLASFRRLCAPAAMHLLITGQRARALGLEAAGPIGLAIGEADNVAAILRLAADACAERSAATVSVSESTDAAIELAKLAHRLPALLVAESKSAATTPAGFPLITVQAAAMVSFR